MLVGLVALVVAGVAKAVLESETLVMPLVVGVAFIGVATVILVPRANPRRHDKRPQSTARP